jgi:predicted metal-dependent phosphoesterase TrpH
MKQNDEEAFTDEVTDDALEAAGAATAGGAVTLIQGSYCFTCGQEQRVGWVERSETHHRSRRLHDGFRNSSTHPTLAPGAPA